MYSTLWTKEERSYAVQCLKNSYSVIDAVKLFRQKYPNRTKAGFHQQLPYMGYSDVHGILKKRNAEDLLIQRNLEQQHREEVRSLQDQIKVLQVQAKDTRHLEELIHGTRDHDFTKIPKWIHESRTRNMTGIPLLHISDIHGDEIVRPSEINYVNEFNWDICTRRMERTFRGAVELCYDHLNNPHYEGIVVAINGDLLSGNIHDELVETNETNTNTAILRMAKNLVHGIRLLADKFGRVAVFCTVGNHGRDSKKPRYKTMVQHNYEWLVYHWVNDAFEKDDRVNVVIAEGSDIQYQIYGVKVLQTHGNQFRGGAGISGIQTPIALGLARKQRRQQAIQMPFDYTLMGHFHQWMFTQNFFINGSIKGYDEVAFQNNYPYEPPQQGLLFFHRDRGLTHAMRIFCDPKTKSITQSESKLNIWQKSPNAI